MSTCFLSRGPIVPQSLSRRCHSFFSYDSWTALFDYSYAVAIVTSVLLVCREVKKTSYLVNWIFPLLQKGSNSHHLSNLCTRIHIYLYLHKLYASITPYINTLRPRQNGRHFPDDIFKCIFINENVWISIKISLKFIPKGRINNIPALVQIMAWRRPGDKPLSEPTMVSLLTHICVTRP